MSIYQARHNTHPHSATVKKLFMVFCTPSLAKGMRLPLQREYNFTRLETAQLMRAGKQVQAEAGKTFTWKSYR